MTADEVKASLAKAARRAWPNAAKASDLPFPQYWKSVTEWLTFHAPRIGDKLMRELIDHAVALASEAETQGVEPKEWRIPEEVRKIWEPGRAAQDKGKDKTLAGRDAAARQTDAWEHAAERAAEVRDFFVKRSRRGRLL